MSDPFEFRAPDEDLADLKRRILATRWPDRETVADDSQGVQLATMQKLAAYWANEYDWRKCEARLNALPNFLTEIDGLDIHFIHVRSKHANALPVIVTHGWPGSVVEQLKIIGPLTDPTAHGGTEADAFHVVIPSIPGYGFSARPTEAGWNPPRIANAWITLMKRLGYDRFVAQGGDWGALITEIMGAIAPPELVAIHTNMASTAPPEVFDALRAGAGPPAGLGDEERWAYERLDVFFRHGLAYAQQMGQRPQTLYGIADSPVGLAAWFLDHDIASYRMIARAFDGVPEGLSRDDVLDNITITWLTNTAISVRGSTGRRCRAPRRASASSVTRALLRADRGQGYADRGERVPRRAQPGAAELGGTGLSQAHPLQPAPQGRALRRLRAAGLPGGRDARRVPLDPLTAMRAAPSGVARRLLGNPESPPCAANISP